MVEGKYGAFIEDTSAAKVCRIYRGFFHERNDVMNINCVNGECKQPSKKLITFTFFHLLCYVHAFL